MQTMRLTRKKGAGFAEVLYDDDDEALIQSYSWFVRPDGYVCGSLRGPGARAAKNEYLHRVLARPPGKLIVDHINGNKLDNRRANLRCVPYSHNNLNQGNRLRKDNTHGFRGVSQHRPSGLWQARLTVGGKRHNLGYFKTPQEAHEAYLRGVSIWSPTSLLEGPR